MVCTHSRIIYFSTYIPPACSTRTSRPNLFHLVRPLNFSPCVESGQLSSCLAFCKRPANRLATSAWPAAYSAARGPPSSRLPPQADTLTLSRRLARPLDATMPLTTGRATSPAAMTTAPAASTSARAVDPGGSRPSRSASASGSSSSAASARRSGRAPYACSARERRPRATWPWPAGKPMPQQAAL